MINPIVKDMTIQEACDYAVQKIVEQGGRCTNEYGLCRYADGKGKHCAVGWLLNPNEGGLNRLNKSASFFFEEEGFVDSYLPKQLQLEEVLLTLQGFHDKRTCSDRLRYKGRLDKLGIDISAPQYQQWVVMGEDL